MSYSIMVDNYTLFNYLFLATTTIINKRGAKNKNY